jgi:hypothetical protein
VSLNTNLLFNDTFLIFLMRKILLTASDGETLTGRLPDSWAEVPLSAYVALALTARPLPADAEPTARAFASEASLEALAKLLGLPTAAPFLADWSLLLDIYEAAPWLFLGELPGGEPLPTFTHLGAAYTYGGGLDHLTGGQWEALAQFLEQHADAPLVCAPHLLAVLYCPTGQQQTAAIVTAAAEAFAILPMSVAWPAVQAFFTRSLPLATPIQRYFAARPVVEQALSALELALTSSAPRAFSWSMGRWLGRIWIRLVARQLTMFLPPSATTAGRRSWQPPLSAK